MSEYSTMDRYHKNGCKRFVECWKSMNSNKTYLTITEKIFADTRLAQTYELMYAVDEKLEVKEYVRLRKYNENGYGDSMYFPVLDDECNIDILLDRVSFDEKCTDLFDLFKLLNNKKNFIICDEF